MVESSLIQKSVRFDTARYFDFDFKICQPLLKSDAQNKSVQNLPIKCYYCTYIVLIIDSKFG